MALLRLGLLLSVFSAVVFVAMRMPQLPVHFQIDGQLAEYLAWSKSPGAIGNSFNQELNPRLFSVYYPALAYCARSFDRLDVLRAAFAIELIVLAAAVYWLGVTLTRNALAGVLASMAILWGNGMAASFGGSSGVGLVCNPEFPATAAICVALALSWQRRHVWASMVAGLAFNVHGSIALFGAVMVCAAALIDGWQRSAMRHATMAWLVCALAAAPTVIWVFSTPTPAGDAGMEAWLRFPRWIYPLHIFVSDSPTIAWLRLAVYLIPGLLGWVALRRVYRERMGIVQGWMYAAALLLIIGYVFVEWIPIRFVAQLTLWRGTRFIQLVALAIGIRWLYSVAEGGGVRSFLAAVAMVGFLVPMNTSLAVAPHVALGLLVAGLAIESRGAQRWLALALSGIVGALFACEYASLWGLTWYLGPRWAAILVMAAGLVVWASKRSASFRSLAVVGFAIAACVFVQRVGVVPTFDGVQKRRAAALLDLAPAIRRACPAGQTVVAPPDLRNPGAWADRGSFLCRQQLTVYAYGPWMTDALIERMAWYLDEDVRDMPADVSVTQRMAEGYRSRTSDAFGELRRVFGVGVAIVDLDQRLNFDVVAENDVFRVYDLSALPGEAHARSDGVE